jgi:hypothetical protein
MAVARGISPSSTRHFPQRDVAQIAGQLRVAVRMREHQVLHDELDVYHAAAVVLEIEQVAAVGVGVEHLLPHRDDLASQRLGLAATAQDRDAFRLERGGLWRVLGKPPRFQYASAFGLLG